MTKLTDQIHRTVIGARASLEKIKLEENLIFCTNELTWLISHICFSFSSDLEIALNLGFFRYITFLCLFFSIPFI